MRSDPRRLAVKGSLRADGPRGTFHVRGVDQGVEVRAPSLRSVWSAGRQTAVRELGRIADGMDLDVSVMVREHTIAYREHGSSSGLRVSWSGLIGACLALLRGGGR